MGNKRLLIVGDGVLQYVPFAALPIPGNIKMSVSHSSDVRLHRLRKGGRSIRIQNLGFNGEIVARMLRPYKYTQPMLTDTISSHGEINVSEGFSFLVSTRPEINDVVGKVEKPNWDLNPRRVADTNESNSYTPLLVQNEIITLPSASTVAIQRRQLQNRSAAAKKVAVVADPVFNLNDPRLSNTPPQPTPETLNNYALTRATRNLGLGEGGKVFDRLQFTRAEADKIIALVPQTQQRFQALDFNASRQIATNPDLAQYQIIHLATHGLVDPIDPELSGIVLSLYDQKGNPEDGFLRLHDIFNLNLPAELVVLSACETGLGKEVKGEGLMGLTRGFMYAGARRVVVSLWSVNDAATSELMAKFYQKMLQGGQNPIKALREAQLEMWNSGRSPYYWAAFTVQGDWR